MTATATAKTPSITSLDTTQTSCTHPADPAWIHDFRHGVAAVLAPLWPTRAHRIRECGEAAIRMDCVDCGAPHFFPERCAARTCPVCARRAAAAAAERVGERIQIHDPVMQAQPWEGPGDSPRTLYGDQRGRAWRMLTLTTPALEDHEDRFDPRPYARPCGPSGMLFRASGGGRRGAGSFGIPVRGRSGSGETRAR